MSHRRYLRVTLEGWFSEFNGNLYPCTSPDSLIGDGDQKGWITPAQNPKVEAIAPPVMFNDGDVILYIDGAVGGNYPVRVRHEGRWYNPIQGRPQSGDDESVADALRAAKAVRLVPEVAS